MYDIDNKILPKIEYRQKVFDELMHFGYTKARIKEYLSLRECEIINFGNLRLKNIDIKKELENMLTALSVQAYFRNIDISFEICGEAKGYCLAEKFEYFLCRLISDVAKNSFFGEAHLKIKLLPKKIRLTIKYIGKPVKNLSKNVYMFTVGRNVFINYSEGFTPSNKTELKPKEVYEWICDRLSDVNLCLIDL